MITVNSLSSGKTSSYMAVHFPADIEIFACVCIDDVRCTPKDPAVFNYANNKLNGNFIASAEHEKSLKIMMQLEQVIGKEIVWVRGKSFDELLWKNQKRAIPSHLHRWCTTEMKIIPIFEYTFFRFGKVKMNIGFRYDEFERAYIFPKDQAPIRKVSDTIEYPLSCNLFGVNQQNWDKNIDWRLKDYPLIDNKIFHYTIAKFWQERHPEFLFPDDSNCRGCHHKSKERIKMNYDETPEILEWFSEQEHKKHEAGAMIYTWHDDKVFYSDTFKMLLPQQLKFDYTMCNSGGCTD
jgi:hypothetical protein